MAKSYVPEGTFTACNYGTSPNQIRVSHNENVSIYALPMATEVDFFPYLNVKPNGVCLSPASIKPLCSPLITGNWEMPKDGVKINGNRLLLIEDSQCKCTLGGIIKLFPDRDAAVSYGIGEGKLLTEYIEEGFDWLFDNMDKAREKRDSIIPDFLKPAAHFGDWLTDATIGLGEGVIDGVVGMGELIYQINQDPVGMGQALWGMSKDAYHATVDGAQSAYNWAKDAENWKNAANSGWEWAQNGDNWKNAVSESWEQVKDGASWIKDNPRAMGKFVGQFIPDLLAAYFSGGTSLGASALKEMGEAGGEVLVKELVEELGEQGLRELSEELAENLGDDLLKAGSREAAEEGLEALARNELDDVGEVITKTASEKADEVMQQAMKDFDPATASNKQKGNFGEMASQDNMLKDSPLKRIGDDAPSGLDDKLKQGIDGIYENSNPPPKFVIDEAKYGQSTLGNTKGSGKQMSDQWVKDRLEQQVGKQKADEIIQAMRNKGEVVKVVSRVDQNGKVTTKIVDSAGNIVGDWTKPSL